MIRSMTGYGKASATLQGYLLTFEVRTLNSKQLDINIRLPAQLSGQEAAYRQIISQSLGRGKVSLNASLEQTADDPGPMINHELAKAYYKDLKALADDLNESSDLLSSIMRFPDVTRTRNDELPENELAHALQTLQSAVDACNLFRQTEGRELEQDLLAHVASITAMLDQLRPLEEDRVIRIRTRIKEELDRNFKNGEYDQNRFEQELIYYLEKLDINEEKVRLAGHCAYFLKVMEQEEASGKKLGFISQEMGREINTIGSKANDLEMQKIVVMMKDELEKIKEQTLNIL